MDVALAGVAASPLFLASPAPYVLLDRRLRIRAVNAAYLNATNRAADELVGADMFEMFPDNPADPGADGVAQLSASLEHVLRSGQPHDMLVQRYDIPCDSCNWLRRQDVEPSEQPRPGRCRPCRRRTAPRGGHHRPGPTGGR